MDARRILKLERFVPPRSGPGPALDIQLTPADVGLLQAVTHTGSLPGAAKTTRLTQAALRRHLERLEQRVGTRLTAGDPNALRLTDAGITLLVAGRRFLAALNEAVADISPHTGGPGDHGLPTLRLGMSGGDPDRLVDDFAVHLPGVLLAVLRTEAAEGRLLFERHGIDALYTWHPYEADHQPCWRGATYTVLDEPLWVGLPAQHPAVEHPEVSLGDLAEDQWIVEADDLSIDVLTRACGAAGFKPRIGYAVPSGSVVRSLLWHGRGVALISPLSPVPACGSGFTIRPLRDAPRRRHVLVVDPSVVPRRLADAICERLRQDHLGQARQLNREHLSTVHPSVTRAEESSPPLHDRNPFAGLAAMRPSPSFPTWEQRLEPEDLELLRAVDRYGSLSRAAPKLLISQPALTRKIDRIERRLGARLLVRGHRGTTLTSSARHLLLAASAAEAEFRESLRRLPAPGPTRLSHGQPSRLAV